jgi:hypothetical protein
MPVAALRTVGLGDDTRQQNPGIRRKSLQTRHPKLAGTHETNPQMTAQCTKPSRNFCCKLKKSISLPYIYPKRKLENVKCQSVKSDKK